MKIKNALTGCVACLLLLTTSACHKQYNCTCNVSLGIGGQTGTETYSMPLNSTKSEAEADCNSLNGTSGSEVVSGCYIW